MLALRSPRLLHWMTRLALAAALLLAVVPTVSRWVDSSQTGMASHMAMMAAGERMAMDMVGNGAGMAMHAQAPDADRPAAAHHHATNGGQTPMPMPMPMGDGDVCAYCPLLASLAPILIALVVLLPLRPDVPRPQLTRRPPQGQPLLRGLGARGPPILL